MTSSIARRSFVSTVLLSRTWDRHTVVELRKEAKARGLSTGNKAALVARLQEHEECCVPRTRTQCLSQAASPGIPLAVHPDSPHTNFFAVKLPDLSQPPPNPRVQIPYVPDFWDSAASKPDAPIETELPKVHVVSGSATHYNGGPLEDVPLTQIHTPPASTEVGFWANFRDSLGLPRSFRPLPEAETEPQIRSRPLTNEERKGLYILLGIVGGSCLVGSLVNRPTVVAKAEAE